MSGQARKKTIQDELEIHTDKRQLWSYALQQRREGNTRYPLPDLTCFQRNAGNAIVKEEDVPEDMLLSFSVPSHFYGTHLGKQIGKISRPMSTEKGRIGECIVFKRSTKPILADCEPYSGSLSNLRNIGTQGGGERSRGRSINRRKRSLSTVSRNSVDATPSRSRTRHRNSDDVRTVREHRHLSERSRSDRRSRSRRRRVSPSRDRRSSVKREVKEERRGQNRTYSNHSPSKSSRGRTHSVNMPRINAYDGRRDSDKKSSSASPPTRAVTLKHEDIYKSLLNSETYNVYTAAGNTSIETDSDIVTKSLDECKKANTTKAKKVSVDNVSENVEYRKN